MFMLMFMSGFSSRFLGPRARHGRRTHPLFLVSGSGRVRGAEVVVFSWKHGAACRGARGPRAAAAAEAGGT